MLALLLMAGLLAGTYAIGGTLERRHFASIVAREHATRPVPCVTLRRMPPDWTSRRAGLVCGDTVVSIDYFKRVVAQLRGVVGGPIAAYESLLDRARREALLRMKADAERQGFHAVINVRLETSRIATARSDGKGTAGVAIVAYGTGVELARPVTGWGGATADHAAPVG
jgi:uncharacterized protein YbjQ (UPF0145 family)